MPVCPRNQTLLQWSDSKLEPPRCRSWKMFLSCCSMLNSLEQRKGSNFSFIIANEMVFWNIGSFDLSLLPPSCSKFQVWSRSDGGLWELNNSSPQRARGLPCMFYTSQAQLTSFVCRVRTSQGELPICNFFNMGLTPPPPFFWTMLKKLHNWCIPNSYAFCMFEQDYYVVWKIDLWTDPILFHHVFLLGSSWWLFISFFRGKVLGGWGPLLHNSGSPSNSH